MPAPITAAIAALFEKAGRQDHQPVLEIEILALDEFWFFRIFSRQLFHTNRGIPYSPQLR